MAMASVRDLLLTEQDLRADEVGGDFAPEACRLGHAVAVTHADLAWTLGIGEEGARDLAEAMNARLSVAESTMPALSEYASSIRAAYAEVGKLNAPIPTQRIHGDLRLHNILRTTDGWLLIDFGGEPAGPLFDRARPASVLRDVGGILRSLDHAARYGLTKLGQSARFGSRLERRADEWSMRNRSAFCDGTPSSRESIPANSQPCCLRTSWTGLSTKSFTVLMAVRIGIAMYSPRSVA